jgi:hypothetical protein
MSQAPPPGGDTGSFRIIAARSPETESAIVRAKARGPVPPPQNREEILGRLRERAKRITASGGWYVKKA